MKNSTFKSRHRRLHARVLHRRMWQHRYAGSRAHPESPGTSGGGDSSMPAGDTWVSGSIPSDSESATQLGNGGEDDEQDDGFIGSGLEIWSGGSLELQGSESLTGIGEYAIVEVDYAADEEVILCYVTWPITSVQRLSSCRDCDWAFEVQTGTVEYHDNSQADCQANGFEPALFELALQNIGAREGRFPHDRARRLGARR